ncbi:MAG: proline--tRNA ligase, partial [Chloroflexi bacterium]|nr:proline--tRNA ligase [Chloroflexota bacterium]
EGKIFVPQANLAATVADLLVEIQNSLLAKATAFRDSNIHDPKDMAELANVIQDGWAFSYWCESRECEAKVKEETKATTRNIPFDQPEGEGNCIVCSKPSKRKVFFAKAY